MPSNVGTYDLGPDGKTILVALMNAAEGSDFQVSDFVFLAPTTLNFTDPLTGLTTNSQIKLNYIANTGNYGVKTIHYNRIKATDFGNPIIPRDGAVNFVDILPFINNMFGVAIAADEVVNFVLPQGSLVNVPFEFLPSSIIYMGSSTLNIGVPANDTIEFLADYGGGQYKEVEFGQPMYFSVNVKGLPLYDNYKVRYIFTYSTDYGPATESVTLQDIDATLDQQIAGSDLNAPGLYSTLPINMEYNTDGTMTAYIFGDTGTTLVPLRTVSELTIRLIESVS